MAKRFGRNQKRALRGEINRVERSRDAWQQKHQQDSRMLNARIDELARREESARRARDTIRITVDYLEDERDGDLAMTANFEMARREPLYAALKLDRRQYMDRSRFEREAFIRHASAVIAEHALVQIIRKWRSR